MTPRGCVGCSATFCSLPNAESAAPRSQAHPVVPASHAATPCENREDRRGIPIGQADVTRGQVL